MRIVNRHLSYYVALCPDRTEPVDVQAAIQPLHHINPRGHACPTPADDIAASVWRHPTPKELRLWLRKNGNFSARCILVSRNPVGKEAITFKICVERFIWAEVMTHRVSRNASSARAIPYARMKKWIAQDPAMHLHLGANQPGMQSGGEIPDVDATEEDILYFLEKSFAFCDHLHETRGLHKEIVNRYDEEYAWINGIFTFSREALMNMFSLRLTPFAHPNIQRLCKYMALDYLRVKEEGLVQYLEPGEWHLPMIEDKHDSKRDGYPSEFNSDIQKLIVWSVARCAWVSLETVDGKVATEEDAFRRHNDCVKLKHATPCEHQKECRGDDGRNGGTTPGFNEYRHFIDGESATDFNFDQFLIDYAEADYLLPDPK